VVDVGDEKIIIPWQDRRPESGGCRGAEIMKTPFARFEYLDFRRG